MIEAMACGTPVIAYRRGSVPEVVDDGVTGFVVDSEDEAVAAVKRIGGLDRRTVRATFEKRFTARRMAEQYSATTSRSAALKRRGLSSPFAFSGRAEHIASRQSFITHWPMVGVRGSGRLEQLILLSPPRDLERQPASPRASLPIKLAHPNATKRANHDDRQNDPEGAH
jgi:hypothetical protein